MKGGRMDFCISPSPFLLMLPRPAAISKNGKPLGMPTGWSPLIYSSHNNGMMHKHKRKSEMSTPEKKDRKEAKRLLWAISSWKKTARR